MITDLRWVVGASNAYYLEYSDGHHWFPVKIAASLWHGEIPGFSMITLLTAKVYDEMMGYTQPTSANRAE